MDFKSIYWSKPTLTFFAIVFILLVIRNTQIEAARSRSKNNLDVEFNLNCSLPQCKIEDPHKSAVNLFHVIFSNPETPQKTNFIYSNIGGPPMFITSNSAQSSKLLIDWESVLGANSHDQNSSATVASASATTTSAASTTPLDKPSTAPTNTDGLHFNITQDAAMGLLIEKIVLFDDTDKSGSFTKDKPHVEVDWGQVVWDLASRVTVFKDDFLKTFMRMKTQSKVLNGTFSVKVAIPRNYKADRQQEVPHLKLNKQSMSITVTVDKLQAPSTFKFPRLAITMVVVIQSPTDQVSYDTDSEPLISDEYTPGVFRIKSLQFKTKQEPSATVKDEVATSNAYVEVEGETPEAKAALNQAPARPKAAGEKGKLGFLYWKEVAYTDRNKVISRTIDVYDNEIAMSMDTLPNISQPFYQYFKYQPNIGPKPYYKLYRFETIYGKGDLTYGSTNYTDFSFVLGLGAAPQEPSFSFLVKFIIFVCFCLPLLVMLTGLGYLLLRRLRRNGDTELLLDAES